ncbi:MAG TPA: helix-turn-helix domain-containing protein [Terriglobales bacterium]|nr:helix-turn-helix domain-containing protein [Terriglobales bacterium]
MPRDPGKTAKRHTLRQQRVLNPRPRDVRHELFQNSDFFDPEDLVQVKYEMLRQVETERQSVSASAQAFGFSRPSFYQAQSAFRRAGLAGLLPEKRGPRSGHKLTAEVMEFVSQAKTADVSLSHAQLAQAVREQFGFTVHPRSIDRQLRRQKKLP